MRYDDSTELTEEFLIKAKEAAKQCLHADSVSLHNLAQTVLLLLKERERLLQEVQDAYYEGREDG